MPDIEVVMLQQNSLYKSPGLPLGLEAPVMTPTGVTFLLFSFSLYKACKADGYNVFPLRFNSRTLPNLLLMNARTMYVVTSESRQKAIAKTVGPVMQRHAHRRISLQKTDCPLTILQCVCR